MTKVTYLIRSMGGTSRPTSKIKIINFVRHEIDKSGPIYLRVSYDKDAYNDGTFYTYTDFKKSLDAWTDKEQLEYACNGGW